jgi:hypothetical protein
MKIIPPITVTDAKLTASNVPEAEHTEWSSVTAYTTGQTVRVTTTGVHRVYEALTGSTNKAPQSNPAEWLDVGPTNRWAMFDGKIGTVTSSTAAFATGTGTGIQVEVTPGEVANAVVLFDVYADSVRIEVIDPLDGAVYDELYQMIDNAEVVDWYSYFFAPITLVEVLTITDLPAYGTAKIRISIDKDGEAARCGALVTGRQSVVGDLLYGASAGIVDYSRKETDDFGVTDVVKRGYSRRADFDVVFASGKTDAMIRLLAKYRATPVVWVGAEHRRSTIIYGYYRDFNIVLSNKVFTDMTIEVEGLT